MSKADKSSYQERLLEICEQVANDMKSDAKEFDGKPFDGKTVATYFGYQGAAIAALSNVIKEILLQNVKGELLKQLDQ